MPVKGAKGGNGQGKESNRQARAGTATREGKGKTGKTLKQGRARWGRARWGRARWGRVRQGKAGLGKEAVRRASKLCLCSCIHNVFGVAAVLLMLWMCFLYNTPKL
jgi:hypothetical protein